MPAGLCAASTSTVGLRRTRSSRPGELTAANAARTDSCSIGPVAATGAEERLDRGQRGHGVVRLVRAEQRQEDLLVLPPRPCSRPADRRRRPAAPGRRTRCPPARRRLELHRAADQRVGRARLLVGQDRDRVGLDDPGLLARDGRDVGPRYSAWSSATGVTTATRASATLVASHMPPMPTSITATSTGASAKSAYAMPTMTSKKLIGTSLPASTICTYGSDVVVGLDEALGADRLAVEHDPLPDRLQVRAGESADAQAEPAQQLVDHPRRRRLAVGAGHLDDGYRAVRGAEQVDQRADAGQGRVEPALRPAGEQLFLDPGQVAGAAAHPAQDASP